MSIEIHPTIQQEMTEFGVEYGVYATKCTPYYTQDHYCETRQDEPELIIATSIPELYERMAKERVAHIIEGEKQSKSEQSRGMERVIAFINRFTVEFTNIFVIVENFDNAKLEVTKTYQAIGKARDDARAIEKIAIEERNRQHAQWQMAEQEQRDRKEFIRLSKKFTK